MMAPTYLDCNATTPLDPAVRQVFLHFIDNDYGNASSQTHHFGSRSSSAIQQARELVADLFHAKRDEVFFTSGATESNNLALLGLESAGLSQGRRHIISTAIEHKSVLEPLAQLAKRGFEITLLPVGKSGAIEPTTLRDSLRPDTHIVSVMHVNNETGVIQPIQKIAEILAGHPTYLHIDAAQGFGKRIPELQNPRIDLISISGHKLYAPQGIGALIARRRGQQRLPLSPRLFGGGQERGLRPGTQPVALIAALGEATHQAARHSQIREARCAVIKDMALRELIGVGGIVTGDPTQTISSTLNISFPKLDSESIIFAVKDVVAIARGCACTSQNYAPSHVLTAMGLPPEHIRGALRLSWCHLTPEVDWRGIAATIRTIR